MAKKRQKLDNVLAERSVRMFINGQWQWVANTQKVIDAQNELADAEIEREQRETSLKQIDSINKLTEAQDDISTQINNLETDLENIRDKWSEMQKMLNGESHEVAEVLKQISQVSSPELQRVIEATGGSITSFSASLSESIGTMSTIIDTNFKKSASDILDNINKTVISGLKEYLDAIKSLVDKINNINNDKNSEEKDEEHDNNKSEEHNNKPSGYYTTATKPNGEIVEVYINSDWKTTTPNLPKGTIVHTTGGDFKITGGSAGNYTAEPVNSSPYSGGSSSSYKGSSSSSGISSSSKQVNTTDQYVTNSSGHIQSNPNWDGKNKGGVGSFYKHADGTRYTPGGLTALGEEGFEAYIDNNGHLIPIKQPTIGNIGAGGIVFNQYQMENLRSLWDMSNFVKMPDYSSLVNRYDSHNMITNNDYSVTIKDLVVDNGVNGQELLNALRRYVSIH